MMIRVQIFALAVAATGLAVAAPAGAEGNSPRSVRISYADLDLDKAKDVRTLDRRIGNALERLCGSFSVAHDMVDIEKITKCRAEAKKSIDAQVASIRKMTNARPSSAMAEGE